MMVAVYFIFAAHKLSLNMTEHKGRILAIDDEKIILELIKFNLENEGYVVNTCLSAEDALDLDLTQYTLIITDVMMGEINGIELADRLKANPLTAHIPIILCSAKGQEDDVVAGLNTGADDYIIKPFSMRELIARVQSVLRRHNNPITFNPTTHKAMIIVGDVTLIPESRKIIINNNEEIALTPTEMQLLRLFMLSPNRFFSRDEIFDSLWNGQVVSDRTIDVNISRLRRKLGAEAHHLENRSGFGYGFTE